VISYKYFIFLFLCGWTISARAGTMLKSIAQSYTDKNLWAYVDTAIDQGKMRMDFKLLKDSGSLIYDSK
jgi:hypothetical protein